MFISGCLVFLRGFSGFLARPQSMGLHLRFVKSLIGISEIVLAVRAEYMRDKQGDEY